MELRILNPCVTGYLDTLQAAVINDDPDTTRRLGEMGVPLFGRAWPRDT